MKIGITGHQDLGNTDSIDWLKKELIFEFNNIKISKGYSCLARGADQLFVELLFELNIPYVAVIPCKNYESTFDVEFINKYFLLRNKAERLDELNFEEPSEIAFYQAGKKVTDYSDILFGIWNEQSAKGLGGTGDIIEYAKSINREIIILNPQTKSKNKINHGN